MASMELRCLNTVYSVNQCSGLNEYINEEIDLTKLINSAGI